MSTQQDPKITTENLAEYVAKIKPIQDALDDILKTVDEDHKLAEKVNTHRSLMCEHPYEEQSLICIKDLGWIDVVLLVDEENTGGYFLHLEGVWEGYNRFGEWIVEQLKSRGFDYWFEVKLEW